MSWSRLLTQTLAILGLGLVLVTLGLVAGLRSASVVGWLTVAFSAAWLAGGIVRAILERLLWRVGRRLLVSYLMLGLVPLVLLAGLEAAIAYTISGQLAARRAETEVMAAVGHLADTAHELERQLEAGGTVDDWLRAFRTLSPELPGLGFAYLPGVDRAPTPDGTEIDEIDEIDGGPRGRAIGSGAVDPRILLPDHRIHTGLDALAHIPDHGHFLVHVRPADHGTVLTYVAVEPDLRHWLHRRTRMGVAFPWAVAPSDRELDSTTPSEEDIRKNEGPLWIDPHVPSDLGTALDRPVVFWYRSVELPHIDWQSTDWHAALEGQGEPFPLVVRTSFAREYVELFGTASADATNLEVADRVRTLTRALAITTLVAYTLAAALAGFLVFRIARATRRLHDGFLHIEAGRFDHRVELRGQDQLAALVHSFNRMVSHLEQATSERAERRILERELDLARELQQGLLPSAGIRFPGLELAVDFEPAAAIGGDFYHFLERRGAEGESDSLVVAIADVSGHGLGTGIVMSAAQSLLAVLAEEDLPPEELLARLDRQLGSITDRRTFVTLVLCELDPRRGRALVTNAGHLPPYRVSTDGSVRAFGAGARPLGLPRLPARFRTVEAETGEGDLWILLSDGMIEATNDEGEIFGFERFEALLERCAGRSAEETRELLLGAWDRFAATETPEDDRTLVVLRITGAGPEAEPETGARQ